MIELGVFVDCDNNFIGFLIFDVFCGVFVFCFIFGVFCFVDFDGEYYVDGGLWENVFVEMVIGYFGVMNFYIIMCLL